MATEGGDAPVNGSSLLGGLPLLSQETFQRFQALIREKTSIHMRDGKQILVANRLRKRLLALNLASYEEYYRYLTCRPEGERELQSFIDAVSTNETYFHREFNHLLVLRDQVLPRLLPRTEALRIWSAGCSTGEEPYTIKIALRDYLPAGWKGRVEITATDINREVVRRAEEGIFRERSLRLLPPAVLAGCFQPLGDGAHRLKPELREGIRFRVHNLLAEEPPGRDFHVIFCRNVMIYFDKATQKRLVDGCFARALHPQGFLFIGHSESLTGTSERFVFLRGWKAPAYRLAEAVAAEQAVAAEEAAAEGAKR
jgi:chemotaxis protein methyltransferase CheR